MKFLFGKIGVGVFLSLVLGMNASHMGAETTKPTDDAAKIVENAESLRSMDRSRSNVTMTTSEKDGKGKVQYHLEVWQGTERRVYLEFLAPAVERGRRMLAVKKNYWSKFPDSKRVLPITRREMIGNSAFGVADLFQMDVKEDYDARLLGQESEGSLKLKKLELNAKHDEAPYHRILYFVRAEDNYPVRALFYAVSGQHIKTMIIEESKMLLGKTRPSRIRMTDHAAADRFSIWETKKMNHAKVEDRMFTQDYLKRE